MKTVFILNLYFASIGAIFAQTAPEVEWSRVTSPWRNHPQPFYSDGTPKPIAEDNINSGDDWWYDHTKSFNSTGHQDGVVCVGYYTWRNQGYDEPNEGAFKTTTSPYYYVEDFEDCDNRKGTMWASIMKFDNDGRNGFCRSYYSNEYNSVISLNDHSGFIAVGTTQSTLHPASHHNVYNSSSTVTPNTPIKYNPTSANSNNHFAHKTFYETANLLKHKKLKGLVTKIDNQGHIIWSNLYGPRNYNQGGQINGKHTLTDRSHIWNIAEDPITKNIWIVGTEWDIVNTNLPSTPPPTEFGSWSDYSFSRERLKTVQSEGDSCLQHWKPFLMCLDKDGLVLAKGNIDTDGRYGIGEALGIAVKDNKVYVSGSYTYDCNFLGKHPSNDMSVSSPYISCYNTTLNLSTPNTPFNRIWAKFHDDFNANESHGRTTSIVVNTDGNVLLPVIHSSSGSAAHAGPTSSRIQGYGMVYMFNGVNGNPVNTSGNTDYEKIILNEDIEAYDLKFDLIQTSNNGYAITSTVKNTPYINHINEISSVLTDHEDCTDIHEIDDVYYYHTQLEHYQNYLNGITWFWDTDAYVAKYDEHFNLEWDKTIEYGGATRQAYPGNAKRQECVYSITENENGSYTVSGNTSDNFDDCYLINLQKPCQLSADITYDYASNTNGYTEIWTYDEANQNSYVWDLTGNHTVNGLILVDHHTTLNIQNANIQFTDHKYDNKITGIYVQEGGKLIINNSTLSGLEDVDCKARWDGIYIEGSSNDNQFDTELDYGNTYYKQGYTKITNSTIKNARSAALHNYGINLNSHSISWGNIGGIIRVSNTHFINNRRSAAFLAYQNTKVVNGVVENKKDRSYFSKCTFKTNDEYAALYPNILQAQITQWKVNGVNLISCEFINEDANNLLPKEKGLGVFSIDATYSINGSNVPLAYPPQINRGEINGYINGVNVQNSSASYTNSISNQDFKNNKQDLTLKFVNSPEVRDNHFMQLNKQGHKSVLIVGPGNFDIRNNTFTSSLNVNDLEESPYSTFSELDYGIIVDNYGFRGLGNIKDNAFNGYTSATLFTNGENSDRHRTLLRCNKFGLENDNAFAITLNGNGYIQANHNFINSSGNIVPVANTFSHYKPSFPIFSDVFNLNPTFNLEYYSLNLPDHELDNDLYTDWNVDLISSIGININHCECGNDTRIDKYKVYNKLKMRTTLTTQYNQWLAIYNNLNALRDGGDKDGLIELIKNPTTTSAQLRNELVAESPYLSDDVLIEAINRSVPLNDLHLADILVANLPLSKRVKSEFTEHPPFGNPLANIVLTPQGNGVRQLLELQEQNAGRALDEALQFSLNQSVEHDYNYITLDVWDYINTIDIKNRYTEERIDWLVGRGEFTEASILATQIPEKTNQYQTWIQFNQDLQGRTHLQLNAQELNKLKNWTTSDNSYLNKRGQALLTLQNMFNVSDDHYLLSNLEQPIQAKLNVDQLPESHWISLSNNPAKNEFYLYADESEKELTYTIHNIKGVAIQRGKINNGLHYFDSSKWAVGLYFITVTHPTLGKDVIKLIKHD